MNGRGLAQAAAVATAMVVLCPALGYAIPVPQRETERLDDAAELYVLNATSKSIDVYVNDEPQPTISDPKPLVDSSGHGDELTPTTFMVDDPAARPFGAYTFTVRPKGHPDAPALVKASVPLQRGDSFSAVFHPTGDDTYQLAIYRNDLSDGSDARMTVRHVGWPEEVSWRIQPNGEDPRIPLDVRSGELANGQWQIARGVTDNDYEIEFFVDGQRVAMFPDLDLAVSKNIIVYFIGDPRPTEDEGQLQHPVAFQELEMDDGPVADPITTQPAPPVSTSDTNAPVEMECDPIRLWETEAATAAASALDPDGIVTNISVADVDSAVDGVEIADGAVTASAGIGQPATAVVTVEPGMPPGEHVVWLVANKGSLGEHARCRLVVTVDPITVPRLHDRLDHHEASGHITAEVADSLRSLLDQAQQHLELGDTVRACEDLKETVNRIGAEKGKAVADVAADDLTDELKALRTRLDCG